MAFNTSGPAQLGADNVVRFADPEHFLRELAGNLGRGRAFVRSKRKFELQTSLSVRIEAPGVAWSIPAEAVVVFVRDGFVGLEFADFEDKVLPKLDVLGEEAARNANEGGEAPSERTVIAPMQLPDLDEPRAVSQGAAMIELAEEEEERTGSMNVPPSLRTAPPGVRGGGSVETMEHTREDQISPPPLPPRAPAGSTPPQKRRAPPAIPADAATVHDPGIADVVRGAARGPRARRSEGGSQVDHLESATMRLKEGESRPATTSRRPRNTRDGNGRDGKERGTNGGVRERELKEARESKERGTNGGVRERELREARESKERGTNGGVRERELVRAREEKEAQAREAREAKEREAREAKEREAREAKEREAREAKEREAREAKEREAKEAREKEAKEAQAREAKATQDAKEREEKERGDKELAAKDSTRERELRDVKDAAEREVREAKEAAERELKEARELELRERETREGKERESKEARDRELKEAQAREAKEREAREAKERELRELKDALRERETKDSARDRELKEAKEAVREREAIQRELKEAKEALREREREVKEAKEASRDRETARERELKEALRERERELKEAKEANRDRETARERELKEALRERERELKEAKEANRDRETARERELKEALREREREVKEAKEAGRERDTARERELKEAKDALRERDSARERDLKEALRERDARDRELKEALREREARDRELKEALREREARDRELKEAKDALRDRDASRDRELKDALRERDATEVELEEALRDRDARERELKEAKDALRAFEVRDARAIAAHYEASTRELGFDEKPLSILDDSDHATMDLERRARDDDPSERADTPLAGSTIAGRDPKTSRDRLAAAGGPASRAPQTAAGLESDEPGRSSRPASPDRDPKTSRDRLAAPGGPASPDRDPKTRDRLAAPGGPALPQAASTMPAFGLAALAAKSMPLLRSTYAGVVRTNDTAQLLGVFLAELRHGILTLHGGPDGLQGDPVKIKLAAGRVLQLDALIIARMGEWVTVRIEDTSALVELLRENADQLHDELDQILGTAVQKITAPPDSPAIDPDDLEVPPLPADAFEVIEETPPPSALPRAAEELDDDEQETRDAMIDDVLFALPPATPPPPRPLNIPKAPTQELPKPKAPTQELPKPKAPTQELPKPKAPTQELPKPHVAQANAADDEIFMALPPARAAAPSQAPSPAPAQDDGEIFMALPPAPKKHVTGGMPKLEEPPAKKQEAIDEPKERQEPVPDDDSPPRAPKLNGDVVIFARVKDLRHELEANIKNGGLFVESAPLALRTHKSLKVQIAGITTNVRIEADVVFAAGNRVGFSVPTGPETRAVLERAIETLGQEAPPVAPAPPQGTPVGAAPDPMPSSPEIITPEGDGTPLPPFTGKISRITSHVELLDLAQKRAKSVADTGASTVFFIFELVTRTGGRGVLTVRSPDRRETIYIHEGSVAFIESHPFVEEVSLGRLLIAAKRITEPALREGLERAQKQKRPLGKTLVALGSITKKVLVEQLREQTRTKLETCFHWEEGHVEWAPWREPPGDADLVLTKGIGIIARHIKNRFETLGSGELETMFGKNMNRIVIPTGAVEQMIEQIGPAIGLQQKELRFLELSMQGERTIADVVTGSPLGRLGSLRLIAVGLALGMMAFRDGRIATFVGQVRPKSEVTDTPQQAQLKRDLRERLALYKAQNHFEVLGVHWSQHYRAYRQQYDRLRRELDLTRGLLRDAAPETLELARELLKIVEKAYTTLSDERSRVSYRNQFFDKTERQYSSDMLVKQGEIAMMRGDRVGAIEALETAVELDPSARNRQLLAGAREGKSV